MRVKLSSMPDPKSLGSVTYDNLRGGMNLQDDPVRLGSTQSPDMLNMWYRDGVLKKRSGQRRVVEASAIGRESGQVWFYDKLFNGLIVYLDGTEIKYYDPTLELITVQTVADTKIADGTKHGSFFPFDERLYYKAEGVYLRLSYANGALTAENILWKDGNEYFIGDTVYTPIIAINRNASGSGGDLYQPENRINPQKTVWFDIDDSSHNYYLPDTGCKIQSIQLGDTIVDTSGGNWPYEIGARTIHAYGEDTTADTIENTYLNLSVPAYVNENGWTGSDWTETTSNGWNYLSNVIYNNFDILAGENTEYKNGKVLRHADSGASPEKFRLRFLDQALKLCPYSNARYADHFILDNGQWMNVFIMGPQEDGDTLGANNYTNLVSYNEETTEMVLRNYFLVQYEYATASWSTKDFTGQADSGWHYAKNCVYSSINVVYYPDGVTATNVISAGTTTSKYQLYQYNLTDLALSVSGIDPTTDTWELLWISENDQYWVFHFLISPNKFYVTNYDESVGWFQGKGITKVTLQKTDPLSPSVEVMADSGDYGFYVGNVVWAKRDIIYNMFYPGDTVLPKNLSEIDSKYQLYGEIGLFLAKRDYPDAAITGDYAIATNGKYVSVYVDAGMDLQYYDPATGEFKASGFIVETFQIPDEDSVSLDLATPAVLSNKLRVTYIKENPDAMKAIADCEYATSFGGSDAVCVVLGGCNAQPNAIFWSGNGSAGIDPTYFPMDQYNLCGTYQDPVTGFGKQQSSLIVFQTSHTSKASYEIETIGERNYIDLKLSTINAERGCDMPWSIALCGNNLVWMHSKHGVMYLKATTSAYENMIVVISDNVNGNKSRPGLLESIKSSDKYRCVGMEDGQRYYAFIANDLYVWDFTIYSVSDGISLLSWSKHQSFAVQAAVEADTGVMWIADGDGSISVLDDDIDTDFGQPIPCRYSTPVEAFNGYYRLRSVEKIVLGIRSKAGGTIIISYGGEGQNGRQKIALPASAMYTPIVLKPRGLRLHHFQMTLDSDGSDGSMELMNVVMFYTTGRLTM